MLQMARVKPVLEGMNRQAHRMRIQPILKEVECSHGFASNNETSTHHNLAAMSKSNQQSRVTSQSPRSATSCFDGIPAPQALNSLLDPTAVAVPCSIDECVEVSGLDRTVVRLVRVRASQVHDCACCVVRYAGEARASGEEERRLIGLRTWRRAPFFTEAERAALAWAEAVTLVVGRPVPDWVYAEAHEYFSDTELSVLAVAVADVGGRSRSKTCKVKFRNK